MKLPVGVVLGFIVGLLALPVAIYLYFLLGHPPVAVADSPFPFEAAIVRVPLHARIEREMVTTPSLQTSEANLVAGAQVYRDNCASCHGLKSRKSSFAAFTFPKTPQLWVAHKNNPGVVGVSDDPIGETYWKVKNGIRLSGMPSYSKVLSEEQMWQVSLLLSSATTQLPATANEILLPAEK